MNHLHITSKIRKYNQYTRVSAVVAAGVALVGIGGSVLAWGPDRPTYTIEKPADHVTFNSITNNPQFGDERNFVLVKEASQPNSAYANEVKVEPGKKYSAYVYFHNNASSTLNSEQYQKKGIALNTKVRVATPGSLKANQRTGLTGYISADNAQPGTVYDDAFMTATSDVALKYVPNSAKISSRGAVNGQVLPDTLFSTGALIGYDSLNGSLPGCNEFAGYIAYDFTAEQPNFEVDKVVRLSGTTQWANSITAKPGDKVDYSVSYKNTGQIQQNNVVVKDTLPANVTYTTGSSTLRNTVTPNGKGVSDNVITPNGINIGHYAPQSTAYVNFNATLPSADKLKCGANTLRNTAVVETENGSKSDAADVIVNIECKPEECKPGVPKGDARCAVCTPTEGQVVDANGNCVAASGSLPTTGPAETIMTIIGVGALTAGGAYWYRSRQNLKKALAGVNLAHEEKAHDAPKLLKARTDTHKEDDKTDF